MEVPHPKKCLFVYVPFLVELEFGIFFFFRGKGKAEEILTSRSKGKQRKVINNLNACMTSTPGFEPSPHWWEESALTPSFSFWFLFVLSSVFFLFFSSLFLEIGRNAPMILQSPKHLHSYCRIPWFKPHANCNNRVKFSQLCCVRKGLNRRGEV